MSKIKERPELRCPECGSKLYRSENITGDRHYDCNNPDCIVFSVFTTGKGNIIKVVRATVL